jgi:adenosine deaminase
VAFSREARQDFRLETPRLYIMRHFCHSRFWRAFLLVFLFGFTPAHAGPGQTPARSQSPEQRTAKALDMARDNPLELRAFLHAMPKGADLHYHLAGGIYAESYIRAGAEDGLCVDLPKMAFVKPAAPAAGASATPGCEGSAVPAAKAFGDQHLYDALIDAFSMRSFVPSAGVSGHDHFFDSFGKFGGLSPRHKAEWLDEVATRAAAQNEQYLELMETPDFSQAAKLGLEIGWKDDLKAYRDELLSRGLRDNVSSALEHFKSAEAGRREREHCGKPESAEACMVEIRFLYQVLRGLPKEIVFAQTVLGFEAASADPETVVGINFVMPEDGFTSMHDYALHMKIVKFLHEVYPKVSITLHAGELSFGLVTPDGLCCHIRQAVEAGAKRIGHGVDVMYEERPQELLKEMTAGHVMVEINLTSNDVILGVRGKEHPLPIYRQSGVPVAISTDDEGVSRIDLTNEYVRAAQTYGFSYADLKNLVRTGLEHAFLPGASLWEKQDNFTRVAGACAHDTLGAEKPSSGCAEFLNANAKAREQWELERRFRAFEEKF